MSNNIRSNQAPAGPGTFLTKGIIAVASMFLAKSSAGNSDRRPKGRNDFPRQFSWAISIY